MTDQLPVVSPRGVDVAVSAIIEELSKTGVAKTHSPKSGPSFEYRGIEDALVALSPLLPKMGLNIYPRMLDRETRELESKQGGMMLHVCVLAEYTLVSVQDGTERTVSFYGEGVDTSDKATAKAMSTAYKAMAWETFCVPIKGATLDIEKEPREFASKRDQGPAAPASRPAPRPIEKATLTQEQSAELDLEEAIRQRSHELGWAGNEVFNNPQAKNRSRTELYKLLQAGQLKGPLYRG